MKKKVINQLFFVSIIITWAIALIITFLPAEEQSMTLREWLGGGMAHSVINPDETFTIIDTVSDIDLCDENMPLTCIEFESMKDSGALDTLMFRGDLTNDFEVGDKIRFQTTQNEWNSITTSWTPFFPASSVSKVGDTGFNYWPVVGAVVVTVVLVLIWRVVSWRKSPKVGMVPQYPQQQVPPQPGWIPPPPQQQIPPPPPPGWVPPPPENRQT